MIRDKLKKLKRDTEFIVEQIVFGRMFYQTRTTDTEYYLLVRQLRRLCKCFANYSTSLMFVVRFTF